MVKHTKLGKETGYNEQNLAERRNNRNRSLKISGIRGFPGGAVVENLPANAGDTGSSPGLGRSRMPRSS